MEVSDFYDFYLAAAALSRGENPYAPQPNGVQGFFNPLWGAFPFLPLVAMDANQAFLSWRLLLAGMLVGSILPLVRLFRVRIGPGWVGLVGWLILLPWFVGQNAPLVATGAFLTIAFASRGRWTLAGSLVPLLAIKPHTVLFLPLVLLPRGGRQFVFGAVASSVVVGTLSLLMMPSWPIAWIQSRWGESQASATGESWPASGLPNALSYLNLPIWLYAVALLAALGLLWWRRGDPLPVRVALALALGTAIAPYIRAGDFPLLLPAFLALSAPGAYGVAILAMALFFVGIPVPLLWLIPAEVSVALAGYLWLADRREARGWSGWARAEIPSYTRSIEKSG